MELFAAASDPALGLVTQARTGSVAEREFVEQSLMATGTKIMPLAVQHTTLNSLNVFWIAQFGCWSFTVVYCDGVLRSRQQQSATVTSATASPGLGQLPELVIRNVLKAAELCGPASAIDWLPRVLQLLCDVPDIQAAFKQYVQDVPSWIFIKWLPQVRTLELRRTCLMGADES